MEIVSTSFRLGPCRIPHMQCSTFFPLSWWPWKLFVEHGGTTRWNEISSETWRKAIWQSGHSFRVLSEWAINHWCFGVYLLVEQLELPLLLQGWTNLDVVQNCLLSLDTTCLWKCWTKVIYYNFHKGTQVLVKPLSYDLLWYEETKEFENKNKTEIK